MTKKLIRQSDDGRTEVAVLISHGFGAGWSTWNREAEEVLLFHKDLASLVLARGDAADGDADEDGAFEEKVKEVLESLGLEDVYAGGACDLKVYWVEKGAEFIVNEYDGSESISFKSNFRWSIA